MNLNETYDALLTKIAEKNGVKMTKKVKAALNDAFASGLTVGIMSATPNPGPAKEEEYEPA